MDRRTRSPAAESSQAASPEQLPGPRRSSGDVETDQSALCRDVRATLLLRVVDLPRRCASTSSAAADPRVVDALEAPPRLRIPRVDLRAGRSAVWSHRLPRRVPPRVRAASPADPRLSLPYTCAPSLAAPSPEFVRLRQCRHVQPTRPSVVFDRCNAAVEDRRSTPARVASRRLPAAVVTHARLDL